MKSRKKFNKIKKENLDKFEIKNERNEKKN